MSDVVYSVKITLESVLIKDDCDWLGDGEIYFLGKVGPHATGRSRIFHAGDNTTVSLTGLSWSWEIVVAGGAAAIPIELEAWDEDDVGPDDKLGKITTSVAPPFVPEQRRVIAPGGKFELTFTVATTVITLRQASFAVVSRQHDGSAYRSTLAAPNVALVKITEILGLNKPGVDDRPVKPAGTTRNSGYQAGYLSEDDRGRIFINRLPDGTFQKNTQYVEITAVVDPPTVRLPAGAKMVWTIEDPDDPTNEGPTVHRDAGKLLDPNDYTGAAKTGANADDNDPSGKKQESARLEEVDPKYALSGSETLIDVPTRTTKVRFHASDIAGDNWRIRAEVKPDPKYTAAIPAQTGIMTAWNRIDLEYVRMDSATELPVGEIARHYDMACAQVDVSLKRVVTGGSDKAEMGPDDAAARAVIDDYCTKASGEFTMEGQPGWFFIVAANRMLPSSPARILYEGDAEARGSAVRLPAGTSLHGRTPRVVRVFHAAQVAGMSAPKPNDHALHIKFVIDSRSGRNLNLVPHDFHLPEDPDNSFLDADLSHYGFTDGETIPVQVLSAGDEALITGGISPGGVDVGGKHYFGGRLIVFTRSIEAASHIGVLCHELCHAFDNAHKCGNWDWVSQPDRTACCMTYWFQFVLDDASPRAAIRWTQNRSSPDLCGPHLRRMRDYHLEDNPGLGWGGP